MSFIDLLQFRVHSISCVKPTTQSRRTRRPDIINLTAVAVDESGDLYRAVVYPVGVYREGTKQTFEPPFVVAQFDLNEVEFWPRVFEVLVLLIARGTIGNIDTWLRNLLRRLSTTAIAKVRELTEREVGRVLSTAEFGRLSSRLVAGIVKAAVKVIIGELGSNALQPGSAPLRINGGDLLKEVEGPIEEMTITGGGGEYLLQFSWTRIRIERDTSSDEHEVDSLEVTTTTGAAELRSGGRAYIEVGYRSGEWDRRLPLNYGLGYPRGTSNTQRVPLPSMRRLSEITEICIHYDWEGKGGRWFLDRPDTWNLQELVVQYMGPEHTGLLYSQFRSSEGPPIIRFTDFLRDWCTSVRPRTPDVPVTLRTADGWVVMVEDAWRSRLYVAHPELADGSEIFTLITLGDGRFALRASNGNFVSSTMSNELMANLRSFILPAATFEMIAFRDNRIAIRDFEGRTVHIEPDYHCLVPYGNDIPPDSIFTIEIL